LKTREKKNDDRRKKNDDFQKPERKKKKMTILKQTKIVRKRCVPKPTEKKNDYFGRNL